MTDFQGIQGGGNAPQYQGPYTWGGTDPRRIVVNHHAVGPAGTFKIRDDYDGEWIYVHAGEMVPLTPAVRAAKDGALVASRAELGAMAASLETVLSTVRALLRGA